MKRLPVILILALCGCASHPSLAEPDAACQMVLKRLGSQTKIAGPLSEEGKKELDVLSPTDRSAALALFDRGALGFLVFAPDYNTVFHTKDGIIADSIRVKRIVFVVGSEIVGEFSVQKPEPNHFPQPAQGAAD